MRHILHDFFAIPTVIAAGEYFDAQVKKFFGDTRGDAEAGSGVLAIGDDQVDLALLDKVAQTLFHDAPPGRTYNVTNEKHAHICLLSYLFRRMERTAQPWEAR